MADDPYNAIRTLLTSSDPEQLRQGLELVRQEIARVGSREARPLFEIVSTIFYIDPLDRPDLLPILDEAVSLVAGFGDWVIPVLVDHLDAGDLKAQLVVGHVLGRIGADAIEPLMGAYASAADPARRAFVLYALSKIKSPRIVQAASLVLVAAQSADLELRDTATRTIGKFAESIPPSQMGEPLRSQLVARLHASLADPNPTIRAKTVRSLGKLAKYGHLSESERQAVNTVCRRILGEDESFQWDRAFIVRKEAQEVLRQAP